MLLLFTSFIDPYLVESSWCRKWWIKHHDLSRIYIVKFWWNIFNVNFKRFFFSLFVFMLNYAILHSKIVHFCHSKVKISFFLMLTVVNVRGSLSTKSLFRVSNTTWTWNKLKLTKKLFFFASIVVVLFFDLFWSFFKFYHQFFNIWKNSI